MLPLLLRPKTLLQAARYQPADADGFTCLLWPASSSLATACQLRYQVRIVDGVADLITIPEQMLTTTGARPLTLPAQTIRLLSFLFRAHGGSLHRRYYFRCPSRRCHHHRTESLYLLPHSPALLARSRRRWWCAACLDLAGYLQTSQPAAYPSPALRAAARDPFDFTRPIPLVRRLQAIPLWLDRRTTVRPVVRPRVGLEPVSVPLQQTRVPPISPPGCR